MADSENENKFSSQSLSVSQSISVNSPGMSDDVFPLATPASMATSDMGEAMSRGESNSAHPLVNGIEPGLETGFYKILLNPLLNEMQATVNKNNEVLDDLLKKMTEDREQIKKMQQSSHIPVVLQGSGRDLRDTILQIENFISYENYDMDLQSSAGSSEIKLITSNLRDLDKCAELAVLGHSIAAYVSTLDSHHLKHLANKIVTDVTTWLCSIFKFPNASAHMHEEEREGLTRICHLAMHRRFPKYATDGYEVLYPRPPVIYISASAKHNVGQHLCHQLGLPLSCVCTVPCNLGRMDVGALKKLIEDDVDSGKIPVIVVAFAGTPLLGRTDDLSRICELCRQRDIWLHIEGSSLTMLAATTLPTYLTSAPLANSVTLNMGAWLALPAVPFTTLFRSPDVILTRVAGLSTFNVRYRLNCVSLWMCLLHLGHDRILARLQYHTHLASVLHARVSQISTSNALEMFSIEGPCLIARYQRDKRTSLPGTTDPLGDSTERANGSTSNPPPTSPVSDTVQDHHPRLQSSSSTGHNNDQYFDTLNIWLVETLKREVPEVLMTAVEVEKIGICIRYAPLETSFTLSSCSTFDTSYDAVDRFISCLEHNIDILDATVGMKKDFEDIVEGQDNMRIVRLPSWAGLGAVQYIPDVWLNDLNDLPETGKTEINVLNHQMVSMLKSTDTAFSLGQTESGLYCVRFGLVTDETDLEELIAMVYTTGKDVEESSRFIEAMSDSVKQGIEQAGIDLLKENQNKLLQEGVLRQVPLVGSLINWWSPPPKDPIKGRTFNLASGKIASTEDTYKYHMQVQEAPAGRPTTKGRDGPLKASLKPARGRNNNDSLNMSASSISSSGLASSEREHTVGDEPRPDILDVESEGGGLLADGGAERSREQVPDGSTGPPDVITNGLGGSVVTNEEERSDNVAVDIR